MDREITLKDYGRVLWRGRWLILATTIVAAVVGLLLTFASEVTYTGTARVALGQPTSVTGAPVSTPETTPEIAPMILESPEITAEVARAIGVSPARVRKGVTVTSTRVRQVGNIPTVATITFTDKSRRVAREGANAYSLAVLRRVRAGYDDVTQVYRQRLDAANQELAAFDRQITAYRAQLVNATPAEAVNLQALLLAAIMQQSDVRTEAGTQEINLAKAQATERPQIIDEATGTTSSGSAPRRLRTVLLAGAIGLVIGVIIAFIWRGPGPQEPRTDAETPPASA